MKKKKKKKIVKPKSADWEKKRKQGEKKFNVTRSDLKTTLTQVSWEPFPVLEESLISSNF